MIRTLFMGTGDIAIPALESLAAQTNLIGLITGPDVPVGRKQVLTPPKIKVAAEALGTPIFQPNKILPFLDQASDLAPDLVVVMAYGKLLPQRFLDLFPGKVINLHASLLPRHRGASPIQAAIREGDPTTGVTVMHVIKEMDAGNAIHTVEETIRPEDTGGTLHDRLANTAATALTEALPLLGTPEFEGTPQDPALVTHCHKLAREHGKIDWSQSAESIALLTRAYEPWPGTHTLLPDGQKLKIFPAAVSDLPSSGTPGTLTQHSTGELTVTCGTGTLLLRDIQAPGKKRMAATDFGRGTTLPSSFI